MESMRTTQRAGRDRRHQRQDRHRHGSARRRSPATGRASFIAVVAMLLLVLADIGAAQPAPAPSSPDDTPTITPISAKPVSAAPAAEQELLARYQPFFRYADDDDCGPASYRPLDVTPMFDNKQIVLRGPWDAFNVVQIAPSAAQVGEGLPGYHLDFPGDALRPDECVYYDLQTSLMKKHPTTIYGRVASDPAVPGRIAAQYWFFYIYNDWKNRHEGDWEMIQIEFSASTAEEALTMSPDVAAYSQHTGARVLPWNDPEMMIEDATHPLVFPAAGSHASYTRPGMYIARGGRQGLGCDDARANEETEHPELVVLPSDLNLAVKEQPWVAFEGRWGELQPAFYNGPTGPIDKLQWAEPFAWSSDRGNQRPAARMPSTGLSLTPATDAFCTMVSGGAGITLFGLDRPSALLIVAAIVVGLLAFAASRTRWQPSNPMRLARKRRLGQIFTASGRMMRRHPLTFLGVGLVAIVVGVAAAAAQWAAGSLNSAGSSDVGTAVLASILIWVATALPVIGFIVIIAAGAWLVQHFDQKDEQTSLAALRRVLPRLPLLAIPLLALLIVQFVMEFSLIFGIVFAVLVIRIALAPVILGVDDAPDARHPLLASIRLTRGHTWRTAVVVLGVAGVALLIGPSIGVLAMILTGWSFTVVNLIAAVVHTVTLSYAAIVMTYLYADLRVRKAGAEPAQKTSVELPAEIDLGPATA